jgi:asparagine synthase (glutamine-hydrolysing)
MPGVAGIIARNLLGDEESKVSTMVEVALHEPFYTHGLHIQKDLGAFIGYICLKDSFADCLPIWNQDRSLVMFVAGESYVDDAVLHSLQRAHPELDGTRGSFLIHLYEQDPEGFFRELNGWLSGIVLDLRQRKAVLFNDRCGMRRLYYHENPDAYYFASEAKSLLAVLPALREMDEQSAGEYLTYDCVLGNRTFFRNIQLLPPGSAWEFTQGQVRKQTYFAWRAREEQPRLDEPQFCRQLSTTFDRVLPRYFRDKQMALALTGGLDTRMILSSRHPGPGELPCYTFGNASRETLDVRLARKVAAAAQQPHQAVAFPIEPFLASYATHLEKALYVTDGLAFVITPEVLYLNSLARQIAPVAMTGKFGSQVLKGIVGFKARQPVAQFVDPDFLPQIAAAVQTKASLAQGHPLTLELAMDIPWYWAGYFTMESSQLSLRSPYLDNDLLDLLYRAPAFRGDFGTRCQLQFIQQHNAALARCSTDKGLSVGNNALLSLARRWSLGAVNFADSFYCHERFPYPLPQAAVRADTWACRLGLDRLCFGLAQFGRYRSWFRGPLAAFVQDTLLSQRALDRPYWSNACLQRVVEDHTRGRGNYLREIRKALQLEMIHRVLLERQWPGEKARVGTALEVGTSSSVSSPA